MANKERRPKVALASNLRQARSLWQKAQVPASYLWVARHWTRPLCPPFHPSALLGPHFQSSPVHQGLPFLLEFQWLLVALRKIIIN